MTVGIITTITTFCPQLNKHINVAVTNVLKRYDFDICINIFIDEYNKQMSLL